MEKLKQLLKERLERMRDSMLAALARIQQLEVAPHTQRDYTERTQLVGEIFMEHLESHREEFVQQLLREVQQLQEHNYVLQAQVDYLRTLNAPPQSKLQKIREDHEKNRNLARLLLEDPTQNSVESNFEAQLRELTEKYEEELQHQRDRYELEISKLQKVTCELQLRLHEAKHSRQDPIKGLDELQETPRAAELADTTIRNSSPTKQCAFSCRSDHPGAASTIAATPIKCDSSVLSKLNFKYIRKPNLRTSFD